MTNVDIEQLNKALAPTGRYHGARVKKGSWAVTIGKTKSPSKLSDMQDMANAATHIDALVSESLKILSSVRIYTGGGDTCEDDPESDQDEE